MASSNGGETAKTIKPINPKGRPTDLPRFANPAKSAKGKPESSAKIDLSASAGNPAAFGVSSSARPRYINFPTYIAPKTANDVASSTAPKATSVSARRATPLLPYDPVRHPIARNKSLADLTREATEKARTGPVPHTLLDEAGYLGYPASEAQTASWKKELKTLRGSRGTTTPATSQGRLRAARLHAWLGEWELAGQEEPKTALWHFRQVRRLAPKSHPLYGLSLYDTAIVRFRRGAYAEAMREFAALVKAPIYKTRLYGFDRRNAALFLRHASACAGYHRERAKMGIPEPPELDPECGAAALAVCLKRLGLPYDRKFVLANCRVTGLGSTMGDLAAACEKMGTVTARYISADDEGLKALPLPAVAYVEHDHFVTVTRADASGVRYSCSDCGGWPGGEVRLTWKQWRAMEPTVYLSVVKKDSAADRLLARALGSVEEMVKNRAAEQGSHGKPVQVALGGSGRRMLQVGAASEAARQAAILAAHASLAQIPTAQALACGSTLYSLHCVHAMIECPFDGAGSGGCHGPSAGDPVNLATLEEEYMPEADLSVYNPKGPGDLVREKRTPS